MAYLKSFKSKPRAYLICIIFTCPSIERHISPQLHSRPHSRPQSLRSFWPAAGIESSGSNHYERTKEITEFWLSGSLRICIYGACLKWLLPELSIPAAGQKDRRLWGRECLDPRALLFCAWRTRKRRVWGRWQIVDDHQDVIVSEKLKLLKISSLKAEQLLSVSLIQTLDSLVLQ